MEKSLDNKRLLANSLKQVDGKVSSYLKKYNRIMTTSIVTSGVATLIAGATSALGEVLAIGTAGWRLACIIAAVFGFMAMITSGMSQGKVLNDQLSDGKECLSQLKYLNTVMVTGRRDQTEINQEYEELMIKYSEIME